MSRDELDVAIVGAGVSGAWCGWRLTGESAGAARQERVELFELSSRVGGRLLSIELPDLPGVACELGGMRYMSSQPIVKWLIEDELGLKGMPAPVAQPENLAYLRRRRLHVSDLDEAAKVPYDLTDAEDAHPDELLARAIAVMAPETVGKIGDPLREAAQKAVWDGRPLTEQGFWNVLARLMSTEGYRFAQDAGGYDTTQLNWNAADTIVLNADFTPETKFTRLVGGYQQVPELLAMRFEQQGGVIHMQHAVRSLEACELSDGSPGVALQVEDVSSGTGGTREVRARHVVLGLPRRSLEMISATGPLFGDPGFRTLMRTVTPIPLFKAFVAYHEPWWTQAGVSEGRSVTDLPLRQVYYWATNPGANSALLATYDDTSEVGFWRGLATDPQRFGLPDELMLPDDHDYWRCDAPKALADEIHRQLVELHDVPGAPEPYAAIYHDWADDPYGGGVNFWNVGVRSSEIIPRMCRPVADVPAYVCGEAYSDGQGWVEGALRTAEIVLTEHLGLPPVEGPQR